MQTEAIPGNVFIISAPSGAGKSTLLKNLMTQDKRLRFSISHTTRKPRQGEVHGKDYWFVSQSDFQDQIEKGTFLEWAKVHQNYYGTSAKAVEDMLKNGLDAILDIDVEGAELVRKRWPWVISIFILPPSFETLKARLEGRGKDSAETIKRRLENASKEMQRASEFDYLVLNDDLKQCEEQLRAIVEAGRCRYAVASKAYSPIFDTFKTT